MERPTLSADDAKARATLVSRDKSSVAGQEELLESTARLGLLSDRRSSCQEGGVVLLSGIGLTRVIKGYGWLDEQFRIRNYYRKKF